MRKNGKGGNVSCLPQEAFGGHFSLSRPLLGHLEKTFQKYMLQKATSKSYKISNQLPADTAGEREQVGPQAGQRSKAMTDGKCQLVQP